MPLASPVPGRPLARELRVGLYIHIPFCARKCHYCDFNSWPDGSLPADSEKIYFDRLRREAELLVPPAVEETRLNPGHPPGFETVYFGGGTPSSVAVEELSSLIRVLRNWVRWDKLTEVTLEANPESLDRRKIEKYLELGIRRISLGVQTFEPAILEKLGRVHSLERALAAIGDLAASRLASWTFDLMYGLPGQTVDGFLDGVRRAIDSGVPHLSLYGLTVETGTEFGRQHREGSLTVPDGDFQADCFDGACELLLSAGYEHYEISNFARPGHQAVHNSLYWRRVPYLALGAGAHGLWQQGGGSSLRWSIPRPFERYSKYIDALASASPGSALTERLEAARSLCPEFETIDSAKALEERVFLGLRLLEEGLDLDELSDEFGETAVAPLRGKFELAAAKGWLLPVPVNRYRLAPAAVLLSNRVIAAILA